jgi:hypothetical protein
MLTKRNVMFLLTTAAVLAGAAVAFPSQFNPKDVAADPAMLVYFDCDVIRTSAIGQSMLSEPAMQDKLASFGALYDIDLRKQLHGITFYTTVAHSADGVMVIAADFDTDRLLAKAQAFNDFLSATNGSHVIYSWLDEKWKRRGSARERGPARVYGAISGHHLVYGQTESRLTAAMDVMDGTARGFDGKKELLRAKPGEVILFEAALLKVDFRNSQGWAALFQMAKSVYLKVSEANKSTTAVVRFETVDDDRATQVNSTVQGLLWMLKTQQGATKLADSAAIKKDGLAVEVTFSMPSTDVIDMIKSGQDQAGQRGSNRRTRDKDSKPNN